MGERQSPKPDPKSESELEPESDPRDHHHHEDDDEEEPSSETAATTTPATWNHIVKQHHSQQVVILQQLSEKLINGTLQSKIDAAREIRKLVRKSSSSAKTRSRLAAAGVIQPLVFMLSSSNIDARESSLLAVRNERNKVKIVTAGAIPPLVELLKMKNNSIRELATAAILTLSAASPNKPIISASGVAPLLVQILNSGSVQGKVHAVTALHNLSTGIESSAKRLDASAVSPLIDLLKDCKKYSKFAEKATALLKILSNSKRDGSKLQWQMVEF